MGGSKGGGTSTTVNTPLTKKQYDPLGYEAREKLMPELQAKYGTGLSDEEKAYYRGQGLGGIEENYGAGLKTLKEHLGRMGVGPGDGASAEAIADMLREKYKSRAGVGIDLTGKDIAMKQQNLSNLLQLISDAGTVGVSGSTTTQAPAGGSTAKNILGGALSGAIGGGSAFGPWGALGGGILGGLSGLL